MFFPVINNFYPCVITWRAFIEAWISLSKITNDAICIQAATANTLMEILPLEFAGCDVQKFNSLEINYPAHKYFCQVIFSNASRQFRNTNHCLIGMVKKPYISSDVDETCHQRCHYTEDIICLTY